MFLFRLVGLTSVMVMIAGCGVPDAITDAISRVENLQAAGDRALGTISITSADWQSQSKLWRDALKDLQKDFAANNERLLGDTLRNTADAIISHTGGEFRADVDYLQTKLQDTRKFVAQSLRTAREELEKAKKNRDASRVQGILDGIANIKIWDDPFIVSFTPNHVELAWTDYTATAFTITSERRIEAGGWGFDRPVGDDLATSLEIIDSSGTSRTVRSPNISKTSNYLLQVALDQITPNGLVGQFKSGDRKLVVVCGLGPNNRRELPIEWRDVPRKPDDPKPVPVAEMVMEIRIDYYTTDDDKDREDTVRHSLTSNNVEVSAAAYDGGVLWDDHTGPEPYGRRLQRFALINRDILVPVVDEHARTFRLSQPIETGKNIAGKFTVTKVPTDKGWNFRVELYGKTNKGRLLRYDHGWNDRFRGRHQSQVWDFNW
jgi:hypothetical protein